MSPLDNNSASGPADFSWLESTVRGAGEYIQPDDDLRPASLEAARSALKERRLNRRLGSIVLLVLFFVGTGFPGLLLDSRSGPTFVQSSQLHRRAAQLAVSSDIGASWALYEVYSEIRRDQADRFRPDE